MPTFTSTISPARVTGSFIYLPVDARKGLKDGPTQITLPNGTTLNATVQPQNGNSCVRLHCPPLFRQEGPGEPFPLIDGDIVHAEIHHGMIRVLKVERIRPHQAHRSILSNQQSFHPPVSKETSNDVQRLKEAFLNRYNPHRSIDTAISKSITASVQHNPTYHKDINQDLHDTVNNSWREFLLELIERYSHPSGVDSYEKDIERLKKHMNKNYTNAFMGTPHHRFNTDPGFRISHAQKSISVFLKHLWCMNKIETPPQCPVDSIILKRAGSKYPNNTWIHVNSIDEHRAKIRILENAKNNETPSLSLAEWELRKFGQQQ